MAAHPSEPARFVGHSRLGFARARSFVLVRWGGRSACEQMDEGCGPVVLYRRPVHRVGSSHERSSLACLFDFAILRAPCLLCVMQRVNRALIGPLGATGPRSDVGAEIRCLAIPGVIWGVGFTGITHCRPFGIDRASGRYPGDVPPSVRSACTYGNCVVGLSHLLRGCDCDGAIRPLRQLLAPSTIRPEFDRDDCTGQPRVNYFPQPVLFFRLVSPVASPRPTV